MKITWWALNEFNRMPNVVQDGSLLGNKCYVPSRTKKGTPAPLWELAYWATHIRRRRRWCFYFFFPALVPFGIAKMQVHF